MVDGRRMKDGMMVEIEEVEDMKNKEEGEGN